MGTIVINQTDCKQKIVLVTSAVGVTGGFYDPEGVWHVFGGGNGGTMKIEVNYEGGLLGIEATYNELSEAVESGKIVWLSFTNDNDVTFIEYLTNLYHDEEAYWAVFMGYGTDSGEPITNPFYNNDPDSDMEAD